MPSRQTRAEPMAHTSVRFPKSLIKRARIRAAIDEVSLQDLLACALEAELDRREKAEARKATPAK